MVRREFVTLPLMTLVIGLFAACSNGSTVEKTIFVAPQKAECVGVAPQECLLIKENADDDWQFWYDPIEGFEHEQGFLYELQVKETTVENPPADASSITLELVEVVNKEPVALKIVFIGPERVQCEGAGSQLLSCLRGGRSLPNCGRTAGICKRDRRIIGHLQPGFSV
jgi:hypothetical protein